MSIQKRPGYQAEEYVYIASKGHMLLGCGESGKSITNIGDNGENLTIAVLSMNRSNLTIKLMESISQCIPDFRGEFLIGDNGSHINEKKTLKDKMKQMPYKCRMIEFDKNYGVAGGRNRLNSYVVTDWIFQLDNDIYFTNNPLEKIQEDIRILGCHFLCMPLINRDDNKVFLYGGNLYVEQTGNVITVGGGTGYQVEGSLEETQSPFLCTFVPGGASIMKKDTFFLCGGYDEGMFVGFEDTEFSMRLFQNGYKIGSCGIVSLIHDHPKPEATVDVEYEKQRFSMGKLYESAKYFEKKHHINVWNPAVEGWVNERLKNLLSEENTENEISVIDRVKRKKIGIVVDNPNWAFHNIAKQIKKNLKHEYDVVIYFLCDIDNIMSIFLIAEECELIHFLWRSWIPSLGTDYTDAYAKKLGLSYQEFKKRYIDNKIITTSVYDHLYLDDDFNITEKLFSSQDSVIKAYTVSSNKLYDIYLKDSRIIQKPVRVITDGVDLELFKPSKIERFNRRHEGQKLVVGWAGNSMWAADKEDFKGYHSIIKPVVEELISEGYEIELNLADRNIRMIVHKDMPEYYSNIDLYICASKIEGTPNPILECMACGVPFISTDVGIVAEVSGEKQKEYILKERNRSELKRKLKEILDNPSILQRLSAENLVSIKKWDWLFQTDKFKEFFDICLRKF